MLYPPTAPIRNTIGQTAVPEMSLEDCGSDCRLSDMPNYALASVDLHPDYQRLQQRQSPEVAEVVFDSNVQREQGDFCLSRPHQNSSGLPEDCAELPSAFMLTAQTNEERPSLMPNAAFIMNENLEMASRAFYATIHKFANQNGPEFRRRSPYTFLENWHLHNMYSKSQQTLLGYPAVKPTVLLSGDDCMYTPPLMQEDQVMDEYNWDDGDELGFDHDYLMLDNGMMLMAAPYYDETGAGTLTDSSESLPTDELPWIPQNNHAYQNRQTFEPHSNHTLTFMDDDDDFIDVCTSNMAQSSAHRSTDNVYVHYSSSNPQPASRPDAHAFKPVQTSPEEAYSEVMCLKKASETQPIMEDQCCGDNESDSGHGTEAVLPTRSPSLENSLSESTQNDPVHDDRLSATEPKMSYQSLADILSISEGMCESSNTVDASPVQQVAYGTMQQRQEHKGLLKAPNTSLFVIPFTRESHTSETISNLASAILETADMYAKRKDPLNDEELGEHSDDRPRGFIYLLLHLFYFSQIIFLCADLFLFVLIGKEKRMTRFKRTNDNLYKAVSMV